VNTPEITTPRPDYKLKTKAKTPTATAYHEAGHAFADWKHGYKIKRVTIVPKGDTAGYVASKTGLHICSVGYGKLSGARIGGLHERIVSLLAGYAAQRRYRPSELTLNCL
jgi:hypothetical protein